MNGCELLKCKYYNNGKCTSPHDTCIHQTPDALDGQTALEERDTLIVELQAKNKRLSDALGEIADSAQLLSLDLNLKKSGITKQQWAKAVLNNTLSWDKGYMIISPERTDP